MTQDIAHIRSRIVESFARQNFMATLGASIEVSAPGKTLISAPIAENGLQQHGFAHAGVSFSLGDSAAGYAALSVMAPDKEVLTVEMKINLLAPAIGECLEAEGYVIKAGKRLVIAGAEVFAVTSGARKQVALLQGTMIPVDAARA